MLFRSDMRDPFNELDRWAARALTGEHSTMALDAYRHGDVVTVSIDLPGIDPTSIDLTAQRNELRIEAERRSDLPEGAQSFVRERPTGRFVRQLFVGDNLDTDHVDAHYEHGVLTVRIPMRESAKPRKVEVRSVDSQAAIEATAS